MNLFEDIREFHEKFRLNYDGKPRRLPTDLQEFRSHFIAEEANEYLQAITEMSNQVLHGEDITEQLELALDSLVDLVYVVLGTAYLHGFDFNEAWRRVHAANMRKVRAVNAEDSKRNSTHDVIKPEGWVPPSHTDLVMDHEDSV